MFGNARLKKQTVNRNGETVEQGPGQTGGAPQQTPEDDITADAFPRAAIDQFRAETPLPGRQGAAVKHGVHRRLNGHAAIHELKGPNRALPAIRPGAGRRPAAAS